MSLLYSGHRLLSKGHHGNFSEISDEPIFRKIGKIQIWAQGPKYAPKWPGRYPYGSVLQIWIETGQFQLNTLPHEPDQTPSQNLENPDFAFEHFRQKSRITKAFRMGPYISGGLDGMDSDRYGWVRTHTDAKFALSSPFPFSRFYDRKFQICTDPYGRLL